jgi:preprotein translocase subunit YajC
MFAQLVLLAVDTAQSGGGQGNPPQDPWGGLGTMMLPMLLIGLVFYFFMLRPSLKRDRDQKSMTSNLKKNDKVLTIAGIYGTVVSVNETEDEVVVKVDDNTRLRMQKAAVARNLSAEEAAKAPKEQQSEAK